jgi:hypothetical protein
MLYKRSGRKVSHSPPVRKVYTVNNVQSVQMTREQSRGYHPHPLKWAYGVTTVPQRRKDLLPRTIMSLRRGGFPTPHLFVDGSRTVQDWEDEFGLPVTARWPQKRTYANWWLSLWELYFANPDADRYALFQDDMVTYKNLRMYLESVPYPGGGKGYCNLYTFPSNLQLCPRAFVQGRGNVGERHKGWYQSNQMGLGAVALIFNNEAVVNLLHSPHMVKRVKSKDRGWRLTDGAVVEAMSYQMGWKEYVHNPSLVQHTGERTTIQNGLIKCPHPQSNSFEGEDFDALSLLQSKTEAASK